MAYPVKIQLDTEPRFPDYRLSANPFPTLKEEEAAKLDELGSFWAACAAKEANRLWWELVPRIESEEPIGVWLLRDSESTGASNTATLVNLMKRIASTGQDDSQGGLLMLYLPLQLAYENLLKGIARTLADRIVPTDLRKCFYLFAADRVAEAAGDPDSAAQLSTFDDLAELANRLREPRESGIHKFLFPTPAEQAKERHIVRRPQGDEEADEEEAEEQAAERERIVKVWEQRKQLTAFLERKLREGEWGEGICSAMRRVFETSSFVHARDRLTDVVDYRGSLAGIFRFLRHRFGKIVILVDQVEAFAGLTETEKATFYGCLGEFDVIAGPNAMWIFASFPETADLIGKRKLAAFDMISLDLSVTREAATAPIPPEAFAELVRRFLKTDPLRREPAEAPSKKKVAGSRGKAAALAPFDKKAVELVFSIEKGDCLAAVGRLGQLLEAAHQAGLAKIDGVFATEQAKMWAEDEATRAKEAGEPADGEEATGPAEGETEPPAD